MDQHDVRGVVRHRPRPPDRSGTVERDGVEIAYDVYDADRPDRAAAADLVHRRLPGRGSSRSPTSPGTSGWSPSTAGGRAGPGVPWGRRRTPTASTPPTRVAVLDATGTDRAVLVGFSCGVAWSVHVAAGHPERVSGIVAISPSCGLSIASPGREKYAFDARLDTTRGWAKYNEHYWLLGRLRRLRAVLLRADVPRAPLHQADRGLRRVGRQRLRRHPGGHHRRPPGPARRRSGSPGAAVRRGDLPGARGPRHRGPRPAGRDRATAGRPDGRRPGAARGSRARRRRVASPYASTTSIEGVRRHGPSVSEHPHLGPGTTAAPAGALPVLPDRPRPRTS